MTARLEDSTSVPFLDQHARLDEAVRQWESTIRDTCDRLREKIYAPEVFKRELRADIRILKSLEKTTARVILNQCERKASVDFFGLDPQQIERIGKIFESRIQGVLSSVKDILVEAKGKIKEIDEDPENIEKLWYGMWHTSPNIAKLLTTHREFVLFLKASRLLFPMMGYAHSSHHPELKKGITLDDGHPMLFIEGQWQRWDAIQAAHEFTYNPDRQAIFDKNGQIWTYSHFVAEEEDKVGLIPHDRYGILKPVHQLNETEHAKVKAQAARFYETNLDAHPQEEKPYVVQFFTTQRQMRKGLWANFDGSFPSHTGVRVIGPAGEVYSIGWEIPTPNNKNVAGNTPWSFAYSENVEITSQDYDEFSLFEGRFVTSIPATGTQGEDILKYVESLIGKPKTFNYILQNCTRFARQITDMLGVTPKEGFTNTLGGWLWDSLPSFGDIPGIGGVLAKVAKVVKAVWEAIKKYTPTIIKAPVVLLAEGVTWLPRKFFTVLRNIFVIILGGHKGYTLPPGVENNRDNHENITTFSPVIQNWYDIFSEDVGVFDFPGTFRQWQKKQNSTFLHKTREPQFCIVPDRVKG